MIPNAEVLIDCSKKDGGASDIVYLEEDKLVKIEVDFKELIGNSKMSQRDSPFQTVTLLRREKLQADLKFMANSN